MMTPYDFDPAAFDSPEMADVISQLTVILEPLMFYRFMVMEIVKQSMKSAYEAHCYFWQEFKDTRSPDAFYDAARWYVRYLKAKEILNEHSFPVD
jgi:hypothetical protein